MKYDVDLVVELIEVFFHELPIGATFLHRGDFYCKVDEEEAYTLPTGNKKLFEIHYGCLITKKQFKEFKLKEEAMRRC